MSNFKFVCLQFLSVYVRFIYDFRLFLSNRYALYVYFDFESCFQILMQFCSFVFDFHLFLYSLCKIFICFDQIDKHFLYILISNPVSKFWCNSVRLFSIFVCFYTVYVRFSFTLTKSDKHFLSSLFPAGTMIFCGDKMPIPSVIKDNSAKFCDLARIT